MEASSEAFFRNRLQTIQFDLSVYTNITSEHLNIHGSFENYVQCKEQLFKQTKKDGYCVLNMDDPYYEQIKSICNGKVVTYGMKEDATLQIVDFKAYPTHTMIHFKYRDEVIEVDSPLLGDFNVYNLAAGLLAALSIGVSMEKALARIQNITINGRLDLLNTNTPYYVMVDYAHTPNGITKLLNFVETYGFKSIRPRIEKWVSEQCSEQSGDLGMNTVHQPAEKNYELVRNEADLQKWTSKIKAARFFSFRTLAGSGADDIIGLSLAVAPGLAAYLPLSADSAEQKGSMDLFAPQNTGEGLPSELVRKYLLPLFLEKSVLKIGHNMKADLHSLAWILGKEAEVFPIDDVAVISYDLDSSKHGHSLEELSELFLDRQIRKMDDLTGTGKAVGFFDEAGQNINTFIEEKF